MSFISTEKLKMKYENSFRIVLSTFFTTQLSVAQGGSCGTITILFKIFTPNFPLTYRRSKVISIYALILNVRILNRIVFTLSLNGMTEISEVRF